MMSSYEDGMYSSDEIIKILKSENLAQFYKNEDINSVIVFGSVVTEDFSDYSDVDIAVLCKNHIGIEKVMLLEDKLKSLLLREIDVINLMDKELDLNIKVSIFDNGIIVYNDNLDLYTLEYRKVETLYKDNETFRYFRERDVIYDE